jgi:hypothetical protein
MAYTGLTHISKILQDITNDLEELNKRFDEREREKANGRSDVLPTSDARTGNERICCGKCKGECE